MWCDNFDMDLLKVIPEAAEYLKPLETIILETRGHTAKDGTLSHPSVWGKSAFFRFKSEEETGPQPESFWTDEPLVSCTASEALRDCWPHTYTLLLSEKGKYYQIWDAYGLWPEFELIMYHIRGIDPKPEAEVEAARRKVYQSLCSAVAALLALAN